MTLSRGAMREFTVILFAISMLKVSQEYEHQDGTIEVNQGDKRWQNQNRKKIKDFNDRAKAILRKCESILNSVPDNERDRAGDYLRDRNKKNTMKALKNINDGAVQLDVLAVYCLYANFADNVKYKLDPVFEPLTEPYQYLDLAALATDLSLSVDREVEMHDYAIQTIKILKS